MSQANVNVDSDNVIVDTRPWNKPWPNIDWDSKDFWDGLAQHKFLLWHCPQCDAYYWPKAYCINHPPKDPKMSDMSWVETPGKGKVFSWNVIYYVFHRGFKEEVPYIQVCVEMDEGPIVSSTLIDCSPDDVKVGMPVEAVYEDHPNEGFTMLRWRPTRQ